MENAVEALKMAFAVTAFVMALTVSMVMFTQAKETSDILLASEDEASYYEYYNYIEENTTVDEYQKRVVGLETVIPTLYKYYKENYTVVFKEGTYSAGKLSNTKNLTIYQSSSPYQAQTGKVLWGNYDWTKYGISDANKTQICSFDTDEEIKRHEPWSGKQIDTKRNLDLFLNGGTFEYKDSSNKNRNTYYGEGFIKKVGSNARFVEELGEYIYEHDENGNVDPNMGTTITIDGETTSLLRKNKKRVITYTLIRN